MPEVVWVGCGVLAFCAGYFLGVWDRHYGKPPPPLRGTYDSGEHDDRVDDYGDWH
jgi:hypothetical protein